ncbi:hypothetical protein Q5P01_007668 [Channa striata]|uniref:Uncharacterized protein n=1 Tax=Channa striata TaxID=64152 RepID=A0AA88N765_CHASR|nr:hypothetical protein Q5P01_007668 [Channa striata]
MFMWPAGVSSGEVLGALSSGGVRLAPQTQEGSTAELEACAVAVGARRGREGNLVRTLIRSNGWCKVARSAETRQETVDEGETEKDPRRRLSGWIKAASVAGIVGAVRV